MRNYRAFLAEHAAAGRKLNRSNPGVQIRSCFAMRRRTSLRSRYAMSLRTGSSGQDRAMPLGRPVAARFHRDGRPAIREHVQPRIANSVWTLRLLHRRRHAVTASSGGVTRSAALTVNPAAGAYAAGRSNVTLSVAGLAGTVTSSPSGLNVSSGNTGSACFTNNNRWSSRRVGR